MAKKFDTNPLDPNFPESDLDTQPELQTVALPKSKGKTTKFADPLETEEQTRKLGEDDKNHFEQPFENGNHNPAVYHPQPLHSEESSAKKSHNIGSISLPENILTALPYIPFAYIGIIAAIIELIFIPKSEPKIRYHAAQGLAAQLGIWIILMILGSFGWFSDAGEAMGWIFSIVTTIMLIVFAVKAFQGKPIHIESVQDLTDWLEERIKPQK